MPLWTTLIIIIIIIIINIMILDTIDCPEFLSNPNFCNSDPPPPFCEKMEGFLLGWALYKEQVSVTGLAVTPSDGNVRTP
jgi:hypothetical protein